MLQFIVELFFDGGEVVDRERRQVDYGVVGQRFNEGTGRGEGTYSAATVGPFLWMPWR